jgi:UDP-2,3-diacylglucosamine pyrophosphatase LpxH
MMRTIVTSDIHLGSRQSRAEDFLAFLRGFPPAHRLILNGDVITHFASENTLPETHASVIEALRALSRRQEVIWLRGNNDRHFELENPAAISFANEYVVDGRVYVAHGDRFDRLMPMLRVVLIPLRIVYECCTRVVGRTTHVASFAKRFPLAYNILNRHVARNAIHHARANGFTAVACGHTHHPEEYEADGISYYNTGCWTEDSARILLVDGDVATLMAPDDLHG